MANLLEVVVLIFRNSDSNAHSEESRACDGIQQLAWCWALSWGAKLERALTQGKCDEANRSTNVSPAF